MALFETLEILEQAVRRRKEKDLPEKRAVDIVLGKEAGDLASAFSLPSVAQMAGVGDEFIANEEEELIKLGKAPVGPSMRGGDVGIKGRPRKIPGKRERKLSGKTKAKLMQQKRAQAKAKAKPKKVKSKKPRYTTKQQRKRALKLGTSGKGTGQAGRTGPRKRREVGEFWWAKSGFEGRGMALWTKRKDGTIVRVRRGSKAYDEYMKKVGKKGAKEKQDWEPTGRKRGTKLVMQLRQATGLADHMTKESKRRYLEALKAAGVKLTEKEQELLNSLMSEMGYFKLSLGRRGRGRTKEQLKRDFLDGMDPQNYRNMREFNRVKRQMEKLSPEQFENLLKIIMFKDDEDDLREEFNIERMTAGLHARLSAGKSFEDPRGLIEKAVQKTLVDFEKQLMKVIP